MKNFGTINLKIVQHSEALRLSGSKIMETNNEVSVSDFKTRVSQSSKVSDLPFFTFFMSPEFQLLLAFRKSFWPYFIPLTFETAKRINCFRVTEVVDD